MTQQEIRLELIKLINIQPAELPIAIKFINGSDSAAREIADLRAYEQYRPANLHVVSPSSARYYHITVL